MPGGLPYGLTVPDVRLTGGGLPYGSLFTFTPPVPECVPLPDDSYAGTAALLQAGTYGRCPPRGLRVADRKETSVLLAWTVVTDADIRQDDLTKSTDGDTFAKIGEAPGQVFAHLRTVTGYKLHKGLSSGFAPTGVTAGSGNCISDEGSLTPGVSQYLDTAVVAGTHYYYTLTTVYDDGF